MSKCVVIGRRHPLTNWWTPNYDPSGFALHFDSSYRGVVPNYQPREQTGDGMNGEVRQEKFGRPKKSSWRWPTGVLTTSRAVAGFRGCWHGNMSWPVAGKGFSYQVCLGCGAKRSFDESTFSAFGPFRYD